MNTRPMVFAAGILFFAGTLMMGCPPTFIEEYNTQSFPAGEATCLSGKQLYFVYPYGREKSAPIPHFRRIVSDQTTLTVDPANHEAIDFSQADPFQWTLPDDVEVFVYNVPFDTLFIGSDGTIAFGTPGTGNNNLVDHFSSEQISLLPVDATVEGAAVRYAIEDDKVVITYENVGDSTFQFEFFFRGEVRYDFAVTYALVSQSTRAGVVGFSDPGHPFLRSRGAELFVAERFTESNLCEDSPY